jgi:glycerate kinase
MNLSVILSPCTFKGSLGSRAAAEAMGRGVTAVLPDAVLHHLPVSDGGEGLLDVLLPPMRGSVQTARVTGPDGRTPVNARWGWIEERNAAVIEMAEAAGLHLLDPAKRDPLVTTTAGVGEVIRAALDRGARELLIGLGGSATNDGGTGCMSALGVRFLDDAGRELPPGGGGMTRLASIDAAGIDRRLASCRVRVACDVANPLTGPDGATRVFSRQKGADPARTEILERGMERYRHMLEHHIGSDVGAVPGSGAAGGLGAALVGFCNARLVPGIDLVLDAVGFDAKLATASLVLTGEGRLDRQTAFGKAIAGITRRCRTAGVPAAAVAGSVEGKPEELAAILGLAGVATLSDAGTPVETAMQRAAEFVQARTEELVRSLVERGIIGV